jgi:Ca2+:H+ antiporter
LIIAFMALRAGLLDVVKASITGSIIGNVLLVLGASVVVGGMKYEQQAFNRTAAGLGATLLALSAIGLVVPAIFHLVVQGHPNAPYMDAPGGARGVEVIVNLGRTARLYPACV